MNNRRYFLLLGRPGAGYITNVNYTLFKSEITRGYFFIIMVKFLPPYIESIASKPVFFSVVFSVLHGQEPSLGHVEIAATGGT